MRLVKSFLVDLGRLLILVTGGVTIFLIFAPLFGYLPYSDRPGPGWYGSFPAMTFGEFTSNAWDMTVNGAFLAVLFIIPGSVAVLSFWTLRRFVRRPWLLRGTSALLVAAISTYWMLGAGWYIAAGFALVALAGILGLLAGMWLASRSSPSTLNVPDPASGV